MKQLALPHTNLTGSNIVLGLMRIKDLSPKEVRTLVGTAVDAGINFFDHADIYGGHHDCERVFGDAISFTPREREAVVIQSKVGIVRGKPSYFDFSKQHIIEGVNGSLEALRTDYLDVLLLHRPDALVEPEEVAAAFDELHEAGKVRNFGVSNHTPGQIEVLKKHVRQPLAFNQVQLSAAFAPLIAHGVAANMLVDQGVSRDVGLLDYSRLNDITLQAWSPFQKPGGGVFIGDRDGYPELNAVLDELAAKYDVTPMGIATAWITRHPANFQVVIGTTKPERVLEAAAGSELPLTREDWYRVFIAAGHIVP